MHVGVHTLPSVTAVAEKKQFGLVPCKNYEKGTTEKQKHQKLYSPKDINKTVCFAGF